MSSIEGSCLLKGAREAAIVAILSKSLIPREASVLTGGALMQLTRTPLSPISRARPRAQLSKEA